MTFLSLQDGDYLWFLSPQPRPIYGAVRSPLIHELFFVASSPCRHFGKLNRTATPAWLDLKSASPLFFDPGIA